MVENRPQLAGCAERPNLEKEAMPQMERNPGEGDERNEVGLLVKEN